MRVTVNDARCQGHGMCALACAEMFVLDDDSGHAFVVSETVPEALEDAVEKARSSCPEQAIEIS